MANFQQDGINFTNVKNAGTKVESSPIWTGQNGTDEFGGIINAIDIDWNGAEVNGEEIHTTGQFLRRGFAKIPYSQRLARPQNCAVLC